MRLTSFCRMPASRKRTVKRLSEQEAEQVNFDIDGLEELEIKCSELSRIVLQEGY